MWVARLSPSSNFLLFSSWALAALSRKTTSRTGRHQTSHFSGMRRWPPSALGCTTRHKSSGPCTPPFVGTTPQQQRPQTCRRWS
jgi:hypothetical protein